MNKPLEPESPNAHPHPEDEDISITKTGSSDDLLEETVEEPSRVGLPDHMPAEQRVDTAPPTRKYFSNEG